MSESAEAFRELEGGPIRRELLEAVGVAGAALANAREGLGHLTCAEIRPVVDLLRLAGFPEFADLVISGHAMGDNDVADEHHDRYLAGQW